MAIKISIQHIDDPYKILDFEKEIVVSNKRLNLQIPFRDPRCLFTALEALGCDSSSLVFILEKDEPIDFFLLKNHQGDTFRSVIPTELPHLNKHPSLVQNFDEISDALIKEFGKVYIPYLENGNLGKSSSLNNQTNYSIIRVPDDFERWIYKIKPRHKNLLSKVLKEVEKRSANLNYYNDPLDLQEKIETALNKSQCVPLLKKGLITTLLMQFRISGLQVSYHSLVLDGWEVSAAASLEYEHNIFLIFQWNFFDDNKIDFKEVLYFLLLRDSASRGIKNILVLSEEVSKIFPMEQIKLFDLLLHKTDMD